MNIQTKIYIAAAISVIFAIALIAYSWSNHKIAKLKTAVAAAKTVALEKERIAAVKEIEAAAYKQKIDYLDTKLTEINQLARKQDAELQNLNLNSRNARSDVEHARRTRSIAATANELCKKLAEFGHPCD